MIPLYDERHTVRPGITGWAQIRCGYGSSIEDAEQKLQYDLYYIKHMSLGLRPRDRGRHAEGDGRRQGGALSQSAQLEALPAETDGEDAFDGRPDPERRRAVLAAAVLASGFALVRAVDANPEGKLVSLLVLGVALASGWAALRRPELFPAVAVCYLPFSKVFPYPILGLPGLNGSNVVLAFGLLAWLRSLGRPGRRLIGFELLLLVFLVIGGYGAVHGAIDAGGLDVVDLLIDYRSWAAPILYFFIARAVIREPRDAEAVLAVLGWTLFVVSLATWREGIDLRDRRSMEQQRVSGILIQPNAMGAFLAYYGVPLLAIALTPGSTRRRLAAVVGFLAATRAILFTYSRGAQLALAAGCAAVLGFVSPLGLVALGSIAIGVDSFPEVLPTSVRERFAQTTQNDTEIYDENASSQLDKSSAQRLNLWAGGREMIERHPWTGVGLFRFGSVVGRYTPEPIGEDDPRDAHNAYILTAGELGLPGLVTLLLLLLWSGAAAFASRLRASHPTERLLGLACCGSLLAVMVSCMFGSRFAEEPLIGSFWVLIGALFALRQMAPDETLEEAGA